MVLPNSPTNGALKFTRPGGVAAAERAVKADVAFAQHSLCFHADHAFIAVKAGWQFRNAIEACYGCHGNDEQDGYNFTDLPYLAWH